MKWLKQGLIFNPREKLSWAHSFALQPTPLIIDDRTIRIYAGFRDERGVSRIGFVDVSAENPKIVVRFSEKPVIDIGIPGSFDENGVVPCHAIRAGKEVYLYYAGYQLGQKVKFFVFGGLAISNDNGETFTRYSRVPITDRTDKELFFRVIHTVIHEDEVFKAWYGAGDSFIYLGSKPYPSYNIRYMTSPDGKKFGTDYNICIDFANDDEYRVARPWVVKSGGIYRMFYYIATRLSGFRLAYAESVNGVEWVRRDEEIGIERSLTGWDADMIAYPSVIACLGKYYMFYNGNNYGEDGFGCAILDGVL